MNDVTPVSAVKPVENDQIPLANFSNSPDHLENLTEAKTEAAANELFQGNPDLDDPNVCSTVFKGCVKLAGAALAGAYATIAFLRQIEPSSRPFVYNCESRLFSTGCRSLNLDVALALGIGIPVAATAYHLMRKTHADESRIGKIFKASLFGMAYGGSVGAVIDDKAIFNLPYATLGPFLLTEKYQMPSSIFGAVVGGIAGLTIETVKQIKESVS